MTESPRPQPKPGRTTKPQSPVSAPLLILLTALDTTWRMFTPPLVGVFLGIWLDHLFHITPVATITGVLLGAVASMVLVVKQLRGVKRLQK